MNHVHWWLVGLSFVMGLVLTFALTLRPAKRQVPVGTPANGSGPEAHIESEPPTTHIPAAQEFFAPDVPAQNEPPTTVIPVEEESPTATIPVEHESPTTTNPVEHEPPTTVIPVEHEPPTTVIPVEQEFDTTKIPVAEESTTTAPVAKEAPKTRFSFFRRFLPKRATADEESSKAKRSAVRKAPPKKARPTKGAPARKIPGAKRPPPKKVPGGTRVAPGKKAPPAMGRPAKKAPVGRESPTKRIPVLPYEPFGPGSARATPDGGGPAGWLVKGRSDTRLYYTPDDPTYDPTVAQVWFKDEEAAVRACFTPWRKSSRK
jgi:hypothetical protein